MWGCVAQHISAATSTVFTVESAKMVGGGCINQAYHLHGAHRDYFVKLNGYDKFGMFEAEAAGLQELGNTGVIAVPKPICWGQTDNQAYLVLEYIPLRSAHGGKFFRKLGHQLAALHRVTGPFFGWRQDNTIGATPQLNQPRQNWGSFWQEQRLGYQLDLAAKQGYTGALQDKGRSLLVELDAFFIGHNPAASILHGDLWSGNMACDMQNDPVIFDPAIYYGDRETDVAMTELFGSFEPDFYAAYQDSYPLPKEYWTRRRLYNLYHILNHLNLFGGSYLAQAEDMMDRLLAELR